MHDFYTVRKDRYFRINSVAMAMLIDVMEQANIDLNTPACRIRRGTGDHREMSLIDCLCLDDGWTVTPEECTSIAEGLSAFSGTSYKEVHIAARSDSMDGHVDYDDPDNWASESRYLSEDDHDLIHEFASYCKGASELGGFHVC